MFDFRQIAPFIKKSDRSPTSPPQLVFCRLAIARGSQPATPPITLTLAAGKATFLLGKNGAGKTSMLLGLAGFLPPILPATESPFLPVGINPESGDSPPPDPRHEATDTSPAHSKNTPLTASVLAATNQPPHPPAATPLTPPLEEAKGTKNHPPKPAANKTNQEPPNCQTGGFGHENESPADLLRAQLTKTPPLFLPDQQTFPSGLTVRRILHLQAVLAGANPKQKTTTQEHTHATAKLLALPLASQACQLSRGQQRRLALAPLIYSTNTKLWLLDEPFAHLDPQAVSLVAQTIHQHLRTGGVVVLTQPEAPPELRTTTENTNTLTTTLAPATYFHTLRGSDNAEPLASTPPADSLGSDKGKLPSTPSALRGGTNAKPLASTPPADSLGSAHTGTNTGARTGTNTGEKFRALLVADLLANARTTATAATGLFIVAAGFLFGLAAGGVNFSAPATAPLAPAIVSVLCLLAVCLTLEAPWQRSPLPLTILLLAVPARTLAGLRTTTHFCLIFPPLAIGIAILFFLLSLPLAALPAVLLGTALLALSLASLAAMTACLLVSARNASLLLGFVFLPLAVAPLLAFAALLEASSPARPSHPVARHRL